MRILSPKCVYKYRRYGLINDYFKCSSKHDSFSYEYIHRPLLLVEGPKRGQFSSYKFVDVARDGQSIAFLYGNQARPKRTPVNNYQFYQNNNYLFLLGITAGFIGVCSLCLIQFFGFEWQSNVEHSKVSPVSDQNMTTRPDHPFVHYQYNHSPNNNNNNNNNNNAFSENNQPLLNVETVSYIENLQNELSAQHQSNIPTYQSDNQPCPNLFKKIQQQQCSLLTVEMTADSSPIPMKCYLYWTADSIRCIHCGGINDNTCMFYWSHMPDYLLLSNQSLLGSYQLIDLRFWKTSTSLLGLCILIQLIRKLINLSLSSIKTHCPTQSNVSVDVDSNQALICNNSTEISESLPHPSTCLRVAGDGAPSSNSPTPSNHVENHLKLDQDDEYAKPALSLQSNDDNSSRVSASTEYLFCQQPQSGELDYEKRTLRSDNPATRLLELHLNKQIGVITPPTSNALLHCVNSAPLLSELNNNLTDEQLNSNQKYETTKSYKSNLFRARLSSNSTTSILSMDNDGLEYDDELFFKYEINKFTNTDKDPHKRSTSLDRKPKTGDSVNNENQFDNNVDDGVVDDNDDDDEEQENILHILDTLTSLLNKKSKLDSISPSNSNLMDQLNLKSSPPPYKEFAELSECAINVTADLVNLEKTLDQLLYKLKANQIQLDQVEYNLDYAWHLRDNLTDIDDTCSNDLMPDECGHFCCNSCHLTNSRTTSVTSRNLSSEQLDYMSDNLTITSHLLALDPKSVCASSSISSMHPTQQLSNLMCKSMPECHLNKFIQSTPIDMCKSFMSRRSYYTNHWTRQRYSNHHHHHNPHHHYHHPPHQYYHQSFDLPDLYTISSMKDEDCISTEVLIDKEGFLHPDFSFDDDGIIDWTTSINAAGER